MSDSQNSVIFEGPWASFKGPYWTIRWSLFIASQSWRVSLVSPSILSWAVSPLKEGIYWSQQIKRMRVSEVGQCHTWSYFLGNLLIQLMATIHFQIRRTKNTLLYFSRTQWVRPHNALHEAFVRHVIARSKRSPGYCLHHNKYILPVYFGYTQSL